MMTRRTFLCGLTVGIVDAPLSFALEPGRPG